MTLPFDITGARYRHQGAGRWLLQLDRSDGGQLDIPAEQKETPFLRGAVFAFGAEDLPPLRLDEAALTLEGFVRDPLVFSMYLRFIQELNSDAGIRERELSVPARP